MRVDFESHFYPADYIEMLKKRSSPPKFTIDGEGKIHLTYSDKIVISRYKLIKKFTDPEERIKDMDACDIDVQVLTIPLPACDKLEAEEALNVCKVANDGLAQVCDNYPDRFVGLALLPVQSIDAAKDEFKRGVKDLGLKGGYVHSNANGKMLDSPEYTTIFRLADSMNVPIFVHPTIPSNSSNMENYRLANTFGLQVDLSLSLLKLIFCGTLEDLPNLKLVISHLGSTLPYIANRMDDEFQFIKPDDTCISQLPSSYLKRLFVDTVTRHEGPLRYAIDYFGSNHILFGSDYPFWNTTEHVDTVINLKLPPNEEGKLFGDNALNILGLIN